MAKNTRTSDSGFDLDFVKYFVEVCEEEETRVVMQHRVLDEIFNVTPESLIEIFVNGRLPKNGLTNSIKRNIYDEIAKGHVFDCYQKGISAIDAAF
jgi:hypothetical protein